MIAHEAIRDMTPEHDSEWHCRTSAFFYFVPAQPCLVCGKPTSFCEMNFEVYLCPDYCADWLTMEYATALNTSGGHPPPLLQWVI